MFCLSALTIVFINFYLHYALKYEPDCTHYSEAKYPLFHFIQPTGTQLSSTKTKQDFLQENPLNVVQDSIRPQNPIPL